MRYSILATRRDGLGLGRRSHVHEWRIHLGAHKTASTHIQHILSALRGQLSEQQGVDVLLPHEGLRRCQNERRRHRLLISAPEDHLFGDTSALRSGHARVVVSEENILGRPNRVAGPGALYGSVHRSLRILAAMAERSGIELFLAIRSPETFLPSLYVQMMRQKHVGGFDWIRDWARKHPPRWIDLVRRVSRSVPGARLHVWCYEDFRRHEAEIVRALCGTTVDLPVVRPITSTLSGSAAALKAVEALGPEVRGEERRRRVAEIFADPSYDSAPFRPFSASEAARLKSLYLQDLAEIDATLPGVLMRFDRPLRAAV